MRTVEKRPAKLTKSRASGAWKRLFLDVVDEAAIRYGEQATDEARFSVVANASVWGALADFGVAWSGPIPHKGPKSILDAVEEAARPVCRLTPWELAEDVARPRTERRFGQTSDLSGPLFAFAIYVRYVLVESKSDPPDIALREAAVALLLITGSFDSTAVAAKRGKGGGIARGAFYEAVWGFAKTLAREKAPGFATIEDLTDAVFASVNEYARKLPGGRSIAKSTLRKKLQGQHLALKPK